MVSRGTFFLFCTLAALALADLNDFPATPPTDVCGQIIDWSLEGYAWFLASEVLKCLLSVPFNPAVAARFVRYYNQTLQFQSTADFLKDPPSGYQQPPFDIFASLQTIQDRVATGYYRNQYAFEVDLQRVSLYIHDAHALLLTGILAQFSFSIPYQLFSASRDGRSLPEVYVYEDNEVPNPESAIDTIDGLPAVQWLEHYAADQSFGMLEPNADWNQVMVSPAQLITGATNPLSGGGTFYPGDTLNVTYKNGTTDSWYWLAYYLSPGWTGPLQTGGDFYNFFVLGLPPANYEETFASWKAANPDPSIDENFLNSLDATSCPNSTSWNDENSAYPVATIMHEACLGLFGSGSLTGYLFKDISTAVLSIPVFRGTWIDDDSDYDSYQQAIVDFSHNATDAERVIIDLQANVGGDVDSAFFAFSQFFPNNNPFAGSRLRDHPLADKLGAILTPEFAQLNPSSEAYDELSSNEWVVTNRIDASTGRTFSSWQDFYGPLPQGGGLFSKTEQYDLGDPNSFLDFSWPECHFNSSCPQKWAAEDIVILTDGTCSSACSLFVQMMTDVGVRTVTVGGSPHNGPMQAASGSRGAAAYSSDDLDDDASLAGLSPASGYDNDTGMWVTYMGITLRNQVSRQNADATQFLYQPANCRIFWTVNNFGNYSKLWHDVYAAAWSDPSICVTDSTAASPPSGPTEPATLRVSLGDYVKLGITQHASNSPEDGRKPTFTYCDRLNGNSYQPYEPACGGNGVCQRQDFKCDPRNPHQQMVSRWVCIRTCTLNGANDWCGSNYCKLSTYSSPHGSSVANYGGTKVVNRNSVQNGYCIPPKDPNKQCAYYRTPGVLQIGR